MPVMSQSGAILTWLAETHGVFGPSGDEERFETLRWLLFDNHKFTGYFAAHRGFHSKTANPSPATLAYMRARTESTLSIVDSHLADRRFMLGERPTIVDFSLVGYLALILPRPGPRSMHGAVGWPPCRAGSRPMR